MNSDRKSTIGAALERGISGKRMTVAQGKMIARDYSRLHEQVGHLQVVRDDLRIDLEVEKEFHQKLITDWNALCNMLDRMLHIRVYGNVADEWIAEDMASNELARSKSIAEVFEMVIKLRLAEKGE